jgi:hypothetical protein
MIQYYIHYILYFTAIGLTPGVGSSAAHIYTQAIQTTQRKEHTKQSKN